MKLIIVYALILSLLVSTVYLEITLSDIEEKELDDFTKWSWSISYYELDLAYLAQKSYPETDDQKIIIKPSEKPKEVSLISPTALKVIRYKNNNYFLYHMGKIFKDGTELLSGRQFLDFEINNGFMYVVHKIIAGASIDYGVYKVDLNNSSDFNNLTKLFSNGQWRICRISVCYTTETIIVSLAEANPTSYFFYIWKSTAANTNNIGTQLYKILKSELEFISDVENSVIWKDPKNINFVCTGLDSSTNARYWEMRYNDIFYRKGGNPVFTFSQSKTNGCTDNNSITSFNNSLPWYSCANKVIKLFCTNNRYYDVKSYNCVSTCPNKSFIEESTRTCFHCSMIPGKKYVYTNNLGKYACTSSCSDVQQNNLPGSNPLECIACGSNESYIKKSKKCVLNCQPYNLVSETLQNVKYCVRCKGFKVPNADGTACIDCTATTFYNPGTSTCVKDCEKLGLITYKNDFGESKSCVNCPSNFDCDYEQCMHDCSLLVKFSHMKTPGELKDSDLICNKCCLCG
jgi:hypothetical protein